MPRYVSETPTLEPSSRQRSLSQRVQIAWYLTGFAAVKLAIRRKAALGMEAKEEPRLPDIAMPTRLPSSSPDQRVRRGSLLPRSWAPRRASPRVAGLSAARFAGLTRPLAASTATVSYSAA